MYGCHVCGQGFHEYSERQDHLLKHHGELFEDVPMDQRDVVAASRIVASSWLGSSVVGGRDMSMLIVSKAMDQLAEMINAEDRGWLDTEVSFTSRIDAARIAKRADVQPE
jgi:hypothetical protein